MFRTKINLITVTVSYFVCKVVEVRSLKASDCFEHRAGLGTCAEAHPDRITRNTGGSLANQVLDDRNKYLFMGLKEAARQKYRFVKR